MKTRDIEEAAYAAVVDRIYNVTGTKTQTELAEFLGVRQSSISDAKKRRSVPAEWLLRIFRVKGVHPEWIVTGKRPGAESGEPEKRNGRYVALAGFTSEELLEELMARVKQRA